MNPLPRRSGRTMRPGAGTRVRGFLVQKTGLSARQFG